MRVGAVVAAGVTLVVLSLVVVLSHHEPRPADANGRGVASAALVPAGRVLCQGGERVPRDAATLTLAANPARPAAGPFAVTVSGPAGRLATGRSAATADSRVTVALHPIVRRYVDGATICIHNAGNVPAVLRGDPAPPQALAQRAPGGPRAARIPAARRQPNPTLLSLAWGRPGRESWFALALVVAERFDLMKAGFLRHGGLWLVLGIVVLTWIATLAFVVRTLAAGDQGGHRARRAVLVCMALAAVNAVTWSMITPSFQTPDEIAHAGYVQYVAETGRVPRPLSPYTVPSTELELFARGIPFSTAGHPSWAPQDDRALRSVLSRPLPHKAERGAGYLATNPPLYYALDAIPYRLARSTSLLNRLWAMRLLSALLAALTVGFVFLFLRELTPGTPSAWVIGALVVAFQPLFAFIGGGVSNDNLLWTASAALLWALARALRRGLTPAGGACIGTAVVVGLLAKGSMLGLLPGAVIGLVLAVVRSPRPRRRTALAGLVVAVGVAVGLEALWLGLDHTLYDRAPATSATNLNSASFLTGPLIRGQLDYLWQFFLPRLPFMSDQFPGSYPLWDVYFKDFIGRFGWVQYGFSPRVYWLVAAISAVLLALACVALVRGRATLRARWAELVFYLTLLAGIVGLVGVAGFRYRQGNPQVFEQARYLLPVVALYAALIVAAVRGAGRRWAPAAAAIVVLLALTHNLFAQLLTIARYYG